MLDTVGFERSSDARSAVGGDGWDLTVVFCSSYAVAANQKAAADLISLAADGDRGLAVVCAGSAKDSKWQLQVGNGPITFRHSDIPNRSDTMFWPQTVDSEAEGQIAEILGVAEPRRRGPVNSPVRSGRDQGDWKRGPRRELFLTLPPPISKPITISSPNWSTQSTRSKRKFHRLSRYSFSDRSR